MKASAVLRGYYECYGMSVRERSTKCTRSTRAAAAVRRMRRRSVEWQDSQNGNYVREVTAFIQPFSFFAHDTRFMHERQCSNKA